MRTTSPVDVAKRYAASLDTTSNKSFGQMHQAMRELGEHGEKGESVDALVVAARDLVHAFIKMSLDDMTKAVPWDNRNVLRDARFKVIGLAKTAFESLATMEDSRESHAEALQRIDEVRRGYVRLVENLNETDRLLLTEARRRVP